MSYFLDITVLLASSEWESKRAVNVFRVYYANVGSLKWMRENVGCGAGKREVMR